MVVYSIGLTTCNSAVEELKGIVYPLNAHRILAVAPRKVPLWPLITGQCVCRLLVLLCGMLQLRLEEGHIQDSHPGEPVFSHHPCGQLFTQSVSPAACGVTPDHSCLGQLFNDYQPGVFIFTSHFLER